MSFMARDLLGDDPELVRLYLTSAPFHHSVDMLAGMVDVLIPVMAESARVIAREEQVLYNELARRPPGVTKDGDDSGTV